jgi:hypothetical protein
VKLFDHLPARYCRPSARQRCKSHMHFKGIAIIDPSLARKICIIWEWKLVRFATSKEIKKVCQVSSCHLERFRLHAHVEYNVVVSFQFFSHFLRFTHSPNRQTYLHGWWVETCVLTWGCVSWKSSEDRTYKRLIVGPVMQFPFWKKFAWYTESYNETQWVNLGFYFRIRYFENPQTRPCCSFSDSFVFGQKSRGTKCSSKPECNWLNKTMGD